MNPLAPDLAAVLDRTRPLWEELRGERVLLTGGTGFFGCWLLESALWACDALALGTEFHVLSRDPEAFAAKAPHLAGHAAVVLHRGDVRAFEPPGGHFSHVLHAATDVSAQLTRDEGLAMFDTIVTGTRRVLDVAVQAQARKFLFVSSGAVYGTQPTDLTHVPEAYMGGPDPTQPLAAYAEGKRAAEHLACLYQQRHGLEVKLARCFAFVGPYLPLNRHLAIGNFLRDALAGGPIRIQGDGSPLRSYMYGADLAVWLWTILLRGDAGRAYNVGTEAAHSIAAIAEAVASCFPQAPAIERALSAPLGGPPSRYVPATARAERELGLVAEVDLTEALRRTIAWHQGLAAAGLSAPGA